MDMKTVPCLLRKHSSSVYLFILLVHHIFGRGSCKFLKGKPVELVCFFSAFRLGPVEKIISNVQQSDSVIHIYIYMCVYIYAFCSNILFQHDLSQDIE